MHGLSTGRKRVLFMSKIKAVIFDMDGVLIDAKDWHYEALNMALRTFGLEISRHDHLTTYDGLSTKHKLEMLGKIYHLPTSLHVFINELKQRYTMDMVHKLCKPTFIHQYALSHLKQDGYRIAVASNSVRDSVDIPRLARISQPACAERPGMPPEQQL